MMKRRKERRFPAGKASAYTLAGIASTLVSYAVFGALFQAGAGAVAANAVSWLIASLFSYGISRRYVFRQGGRWSARELGAFLGARGAACAAETLMVWLLIGAMTFPWVPAKLGGSDLSFLLNYAVCDLVVFPAERRKTPML